MSCYLLYFGGFVGSWVRGLVGSWEKTTIELSNHQTIKLFFYYISDFNIHLFTR